MRKQLPLFLFLIILFSISLISFCPPAKATTIFSDGFESGDFSAWTNTTGTPEVVNTYAHHGIYSEKINDTTTEYATKTFGSTYADFYVRCYVYFTSLPPSDNYGIGVITAGKASSWAYATIVRIQQVSGVDRFGILSGAHSYVNGSSIVQTGQWYCIELHRKTGSGKTELFVNGSLEASFAYDYYDVDTLWSGGTAQLSSVAYIDCVVVADAYIGIEGGATTLKFYNAFSLSPWIADGRRFYLSRESSFSESFSYNVERSLIVSRKSVFSALFSVNDRRLITVSRTSFFSQGFSIDTILSILKLNEYHFSTVITFSYSLTHGRSITIFRGSTFAETFSIDHTFSLFQFGHYSFSSIFNVPFTIYDVVSSTAPYGMGDVIAIAILALIIAICAAVIAITWD